MLFRVVGGEDPSMPSLRRLIEVDGFVPLNGELSGSWPTGLRRLPVLEGVMRSINMAH
jgi:hypothetical protein